MLEKELPLILQFYSLASVVIQIIEPNTYSGLVERLHINAIRFPGVTDQGLTHY